MVQPEQRDESRIEFTHAPDVNIVAIDGTWRRACKLLDVSQTGAKLEIEQVEKLPSKEFFLVLSSTGAAYRRCQLVWVNGPNVGVTFLQEAKKPR